MGSKSINLVEINVERTADAQPSETAGPHETSELFPDGGWRAYSVVLGLFLGLVVNFGFLNAVGAVQAYVSSHQLAGEKVSSVSWVFSIYVSLPFLLGAFVGPVFDTHGSTRLLMMSTVLLTGGFMAVSWSSSIVAFIFSLSLCMGAGHALAITPCVSLVSHWFLLNRGKALGLASLGGSIGGTFWPLILNGLYSSVGFGWAIRICGFICLASMLVCVSLVKTRVSRKITQTEGDEIAKARRFLQTTKDFFDVGALKDPPFAFLVAGVFLTEVSLMSILTYMASYAMAHGFTEKNALILVTIFNACGALGRYFPGILADKYGNFNVMVIMLTGFTISVLVVWLPFGHKRLGLYLFSVLCGFFSSSILGLTPVCLGSISQVDKFGQRYGLMYTCSSTGILFGIPVGAAIIGNGSSQNYTHFAGFCGAFACAGTISWFCSRWTLVGMQINKKV